MTELADALKSAQEKRKSPLHVIQPAAERPLPPVAISMMRRQKALIDVFAGDLFTQERPTQINACAQTHHRWPRVGLMPCGGCELAMNV